MANDEFREDQESRRQFGKAKQHEKRLENATYTAAEVKVLTETATRLGRELGRREARAEIYGELSFVDDWVLNDPRVKWVDVQIDKGTYRELRAAFDGVSDEHSGGGE